MSKKTVEFEEMEPLAEEATEEVISDTPDYRELWQRALADHDNLRKRMEVDRQNFAKFSLEGFIQDLLPVVDNFYRATEHVPVDRRNDGWVTGILYIQKQLLDVLTQEGLTEIPAKVGDHFDPTHQEAIGTAHNAEVEEDTIIEIKNKGYQLHGRMLRPTQVIVNKHQ